MYMYTYLCICICVSLQKHKWEYLVEISTLQREWKIDTLELLWMNFFTWKTLNTWFKIYSFYFYDKYIFSYTYSCIFYFYVFALSAIVFFFFSILIFRFLSNRNTARDDELTKLSVAIDIYHQRKKEEEKRTDEFPYFLLLNEIQLLVNKLVEFSR